jgi:hypothetical protein
MFTFFALKLSKHKLWLIIISLTCLIRPHFKAEVKSRFDIWTELLSILLILESSLGSKA